MPKHIVAIACLLLTLAGCAQGGYGSNAGSGSGSGSGSISMYGTLDQGVSVTRH